MRKRIDLFADDKRSLFAKRLEFALEADGITQSEFAERIGVSRSMINKYICGLATPSFAVLMKIQKALDISLDWLLGLVD